jgi:hypothetical protein
MAPKSIAPAIAPALTAPETERRALRAESNMDKLHRIEKGRNQWWLPTSKANQNQTRLSLPCR